MGVQSLVQSGGGTDWSKTTNVTKQYYQIALNPNSFDNYDLDLLTVNGAGIALEFSLAYNNNVGDSFRPYVKIDGGAKTYLIDAYDINRNYGVYSYGYLNTLSSTTSYLYVLKNKIMIPFKTSIVFGTSSTTTNNADAGININYSLF
jgi:hypothetical protein